MENHSKRNRVWADVSDELLERLRAYAERDDRSLAWVVRTAVEQYDRRRQGASPATPGEAA